MSTPDPPDTRPSTQMVADLVRTRLVEEAGHMDDGSTGTVVVDDFTDETYPSVTQAERIIDQAVLATAGQIPGSIVESNPTAVQHLSALYAAILIEGSYFREQLTDDQVDLYWELYKAGIRGVLSSSDGGGGGAGPAVQGSGMVDSVVATGVTPYPWLYPYDPYIPYG